MSTQVDPGPKPHKKVPRRRPPREKIEIHSDDRNVWDRQPGEHPKAWEAFTKYRDAGLTRSTIKVAEELGRPRTTLASYSTRYSWVIRVAAWDAEQDRQDQLWLQQERKKAKIRHVRQAQGLANKWLTRLATLNPDELSPSDVVRYADIATRMEREALDMDGKKGVLNETLHLHATVGALTPQDTRVRLEALQREINERLTSPQALPQGVETTPLQEILAEDPATTDRSEDADGTEYAELVEDDEETTP